MKKQRRIYSLTASLFILSMFFLLSSAFALKVQAQEYYDGGDYNQYENDYNNLSNEDFCTKYPSECSVDTQEYYDGGDYNQYENDYNNLSNEDFCAKYPAECLDGNQDPQADIERGITEAGSYSRCAGFCQSTGDFDNCISRCAAEYDVSDQGGLGTGSDYECPENYIPDPKDPSSCIVAVGIAGSGCLNDNECSEGYKCNESNTCVVDSMVGSECMDDHDCSRLKGPGSQCTGIFQKTCSDAAQSPEDLAAAQKAKNEAKSEAIAASSRQEAAARKLNTATQEVKTACASGDAAKCTAATTALTQAKEDYDKAKGETISAVERANELSGNPSSGAGFKMCANGVLAPICPDGGTPYVIGVSTGSYGGYGGGGGYGGSSGLGGATTFKCGSGFTEIGGVCFPSNTGLSEAPLYVILSNLFSWLMGLFTTLAVVAFVISGIQYLLASGDEDLAKSAKTNAKNAIIGIIIGLSGFIIIKAIAAALSGQGYFF